MMSKATRASPLQELRVAALASLAEDLLGAATETSVASSHPACVRQGGGWPLHRSSLQASFPMGALEAPSDQQRLTGEKMPRTSPTSDTHSARLSCHQLCEIPSGFFLSFSVFFKNRTWGNVVYAVSSKVGRAAGTHSRFHISENHPSRDSLYTVEGADGPGGSGFPRSRVSGHRSPCPGTWTPDNTAKLGVGGSC